MLKLTNTRPTPFIRPHAPEKTYSLGAQLAGPDYLRDTTRRGYHLGISDGIMHTVSGFFREEPGARDLSLRQQATVARHGLEMLSASQPELFKASAGDDFHARAEKAKLSAGLQMLRDVERTGKMPERAWGSDPTRTFVAHMLNTADR